MFLHLPMLSLLLVYVCSFIFLVRILNVSQAFMTVKTNLSHHLNTFFFVLQGTPGLPVS